MSQAAVESSDNTQQSPIAARLIDTITSFGISKAYAGEMVSAILDDVSDIISVESRIPADLLLALELQRRTFESLPYGLIQINPSETNGISIEAVNPEVVRNFQLDLGFQIHESREFCEFLLREFEVADEDTTHPRTVIIKRQFVDEFGYTRERIVQVSKTSTYIEERALYWQTLALEDITHNVQLENRYEAFFDTWQQVAYIIDFNGVAKEIHINRQSVASDLKPGDNVFEYFTNKISPELAIDFQQQVETTRNTTVPTNETYYDGKTVYSISMLRINDYELAVVSQDITENEQAVLEIIKLMEGTRAERMQRESAEKLLRTIGTLVNGVDHDLRQPFTAIKAAAHIIKKLILSKNDGLVELDSNTNKILEYIEVILGRVDWATQVLATLKSYVNLGSEGVSLHPLEINSFISDHFGEWEEQKHRLKGNFPTPAVSVLTDKVFFGHIIQNLVANAIKYSEGDIIVSTSTTENGYFRVEVQDSGMGIPPEQHDNVWLLFGRTDEARRSSVIGTGIGLAAVKRIAEEILGGKVWFESEVGVGTTFFVELPMNLEP